jgi:ankyrin repeat protein
VTARLRPTSDVRDVIRLLKPAATVSAPPGIPAAAVQPVGGRPSSESRSRRRLLTVSLRHAVLMRALLDRGLVDPNAQLTHQQRPGRRRQVRLERLIHVAARRGDPELVDLLLAFGATPNVLDSDADTPLHVAVRNSDSTVAALLLTRGGSDPDVRDRRGDTPLHIAARQGHLQMVTTLLAHGADHEVADRRRGDRPVHIAAAGGHAHVVETLCRADPSNAEVRSATSGCCPLHLAAAGGNVETVRTLLDDGIGADESAVDDDGNTALHWLVLRPYQPGATRDPASFYATAVELVKGGVPIDLPNAAGQTPLSLAAANQFPRIAQLLVANGAKMSSAVPMATTPLSATTPEKKFTFHSSPPTKQFKISSSDRRPSIEDALADDSINRGPARRDIPVEQWDFRREANVVGRPTADDVTTERVVAEGDQSLKRKAAPKFVEPKPSDFEPVRYRRERPSIENEISTFSVITRVGGERMTILLDQKQHQTSNEERIRSRRSIEGEMNRIPKIEPMSSSTGGHERRSKLVAVDIDITNDAKARLAGGDDSAKQFSDPTKDSISRKHKLVENAETSGSPSFGKSPKISDIKRGAEHSKLLTEVATTVADDDALLDQNLSAGWTDRASLRPGVVSPVALHDLRRYSTPPFRLGLGGGKSPWGFMSDFGGATRRTRLRVAGVVPKAYNRRQKDAARAAFFAARPVGIERVGIGDSDRDDISMISMTSMPEMGYVAWERSLQRHREWSEPLEPIYGKPLALRAGQLDASLSSWRSRSVGEVDRRSEGKPLIGPYASPYRSFGPIEVQTDAIEEAILDDDSSFGGNDDEEWVDEDLPEPQWDSAEMDNSENPLPPQILDRQEALQEILSRAMPADSTPARGEGLQEKERREHEQFYSTERVELKLTANQSATSSVTKVTQKFRGNLPAEETKSSPSQREKSVGSSAIMPSETRPVFEDHVHKNKGSVKKPLASGPVTNSGLTVPKMQRLTDENMVIAVGESLSSSASSSDEDDDKSDDPERSSPLQMQQSPVKGILKSPTKYRSEAFISFQKQNTKSEQESLETELVEKQKQSNKKAKNRSVETAVDDERHMPLPTATVPNESKPRLGQTTELEATKGVVKDRRPHGMTKKADEGKTKLESEPEIEAIFSEVAKKKQQSDDWNDDDVQEYDEEPGRRRRLNESDRSSGPERNILGDLDGEELEKYDTEPGARRLSLKQKSDREASDDEPKPSKSAATAKQTGKPVSPVSLLPEIRIKEQVQSGRHLPEVDDAMILSQDAPGGPDDQARPPQKQKPSKYQSVMLQNRDKTGFSKLPLAPTLSSSSQQQTRVESDVTGAQSVKFTSALQDEVWQEAMEGQPLASSETVYEQKRKELPAAKLTKRHKPRSVRELKRGRGGDVDVDVDVDEDELQRKIEHDEAFTASGSKRNKDKPVCVTSIDTGITEASIDDDYEVVISDSDEPQVVVAKVEDEYLSIGTAKLSVGGDAAASTPSKKLTPVSDQQKVMGQVPVAVGEQSSLKDRVKSTSVGEVSGGRPSHTANVSDKRLAEVALDTRSDEESDQDEGKVEAGISSIESERSDRKAASSLNAADLRFRSAATDTTVQTASSENRQLGPELHKGRKLHSVKRQKSKPQEVNFDSNDVLVSESPAKPVGGASERLVEKARIEEIMDLSDQSDGEVWSDEESGELPTEYHKIKPSSGQDWRGQISPIGFQQQRIIEEDTAEALPNAVKEASAEVSKQKAAKKKPSRPKLPEGTLNEYDKDQLVELRAALQHLENGKKTGKTHALDETAKLKLLHQRTSSSSSSNSSRSSSSSDSDSGKDKIAKSAKGSRTKRSKSRKLDENSTVAGAEAPEKAYDNDTVKTKLVKVKQDKETTVAGERTSADKTDKQLQDKQVIVSSPSLSGGKEWRNLHGTSQDIDVTPLQEDTKKKPLASKSKNQRRNLQTERNNKPIVTQASNRKSHKQKES